MIRFVVLRSVLLALLVVFAAPALVPSARGQAPKKLPWTRGAVPGKPGAQRAESIRELLVNIEPSQWANFRDGEELTVDEDETLFRVLFRLPTIGLDEFHRLARPWDSAQADSAPSAAKSNLFRLQGRIVAADRVEILEEVSRRLGFDHYWRVRLRLDGDAGEAIVCARSVPAAWRTAPALDERGATFGVYLKPGAARDGRAPYYFAADRIEWRPDRADSDRGIAPDHVLLSDLGFDFSRLAELDGRDARPLGDADQECFYQMLDAARRATPEQLGTAAPFEIAPFLVKPSEHHGELFRIRARLKRITPVEIGEAALEERFGFGRYYQLDMVIGLGDQEVRLARGPNDADAPVLKNFFPLVACVADLPESLRSVAQKKEINEDVEFDGFYFRLWSFQSAMLNRFAADRGTGEDGGVDARKVEAARRRQPSPLFLAGTVRVYADEERDSGWFGRVMGGLIVAIIAGLVGMKWYAGATDRRAREQLRRTLEGPPKS